MPIAYLRRLTSPQRSEQSNRHLARYLAFVAGAENAGSFLAIGHYTSHMSGTVAAMSDDLALGETHAVLVGLVAVVSFILGSLFTTLLIRWGRARRLHSEYALPLLAEAFLFCAFSATVLIFHKEKIIVTLALMAFTMGLQNAMITKISGSVIRTTHVTGIVTDIGIALGRMLTPRAAGSPVDLAHERMTLSLLGSLVLLFFLGGVLGAFSYRQVGFVFVIPLAVTLLLIAAVPVIDDLRGLRQPAL